MNNIITLAILLVLTATAAVTANVMQDSRYLVLTVLGLGVAKLFLVAYQFMELKKAHLFWKVALTFVIGLFITTSCIILR